MLLEEPDEIRHIFIAQGIGDMSHWLLAIGEQTFGFQQNPLMDQVSSTLPQYLVTNPTQVPGTHVHELGIVAWLSVGFEM